MNRRLLGKSFCGMAIFTTIVSGCYSQVADVIPKNGSAPTSAAWNIGEIQNEFFVSSLADSGPGSLREAIILANQADGTDRISFSSETDLYDQPQSIVLESPLPLITDNLIIDGYIKDRLWKKSGVTISGQHHVRIVNIAPSTKVKIKHLTLTQGQAENGGAIYSHGELVVEGSTFMENHATANGGAIFANGNRAVIYNSTFLKNSAMKSGGGLLVGAGYVSSTNNTFTENKAAWGGAIANYGTLEINNTILANSLADHDCVSTGRIVNNKQSIIERQNGCGVPYTSDDPGLGSLGHYNGPVQTITLSARSPAVNYGDNRVAINELGEPLKWDQRGNGDPRYAAGITDIGAFETQAQNILTVDTLEDVDYRWCTIFKNDCSLRGALLIANNDKRFSTITFDSRLFANNEILQIRKPLPELTSKITLDGTGSGTITLLGPAQIIRVLRNSEHIELLNITVLSNGR